MPPLVDESGHRDRPTVLTANQLVRLLHLRDWCPLSGHSAEKFVDDTPHTLNFGRQIQDGWVGATEAASARNTSRRANPSVNSATNFARSSWILAKSSSALANRFLARSTNLVHESNRSTTGGEGVSCLAFFDDS